MDDKHTPRTLCRSGIVGYSTTATRGGLHEVGEGADPIEAHRKAVAWFANSDDAALFAAAPTLLETLREAEQSLMRLADADGAYRVTVLTTVRAAINLATTGEES